MISTRPLMNPEAMNVNSPSQLTLELFNSRRISFADFLGASNAAPRAALERWAAGAGHWCLGIWGQRGVGKSHLLQAAVCAAHARGAVAMYVPLREVFAHGPAVLQDLEQIDSLALDDLEIIAGDAAWEAAVFTLYNAVAAIGGRIIYASSHAPTNLPCALADLKSRLCSALIYQVSDPLEAEKHAILQALAHTRGLQLSPVVANFLLRRLPRDLHALVPALEQLDRASLRDGRALTIPFVREALGFDAPE